MSVRSKQPAPLLGFESVTRYWDGRRKLWAAKIGPGEYYVTLSGELIVTVLGSCVAACVRDPERGVGGMNHFMLPGGSGMAQAQAASTENRYGCFAMESLINSVLRHGGQRHRLEVKLFGGGRILRRMTDVGERNVEFACRYVESESLNLLSHDLGGDLPRKVYYSPTSGRVRLKRLRDLHNRTVIERETSYAQKLEVEPVTGDVELFD